MQSKPLHIISFDNPFPPVYGGVIDVFFKIKALNQTGFAIHLHCFTDRNNQLNPELERLVASVHFYPRRKHIKWPLLFSAKPFAVISRQHPGLLKNLLKIDAPLLFEGLQTTHLALHPKLQDRKKILRLHNLESNYFGGMAKSESKWYKKLLYWLESVRYATYQGHIAKFDTTLTLSVSETEYVQQQFGNAVYIPVFHGNTQVAPLDEFGKYALYHGDLRLADNFRAAKFLIEVFAKIPDYPLVIASNSAAEKIGKLIQNYYNISFVSIENQQHLQTLLRDAHINVMLSFQQSGTKLKLVNSLYNSRFCIVNQNMADDPELLQLCSLARSQDEFRAVIAVLQNQPYLEHENRKAVLSKILDDSKNAEKIREILS